MPQSPTALSAYLSPSDFIDSDHPDIKALSAGLTDNCQDTQTKALALYYWVRDEIRYNPYAIDMSPNGFLASTTLKMGYGWCVSKAVLLSALCRAAGIPARVGFADVVNHLSTERMRNTMQTDVFYYHGYSSLWLNDKWVKCTPAFNLSLCEKFNLRPLEFDGVNDSLYHEFDQAGNKHMEYLQDRGEYIDVPLTDLLAVFAEHYPKMNETTPLQAADWQADVAQETASGN